MQKLSFKFFTLMIYIFDPFVSFRDIVATVAATSPLSSEAETLPTCPQIRVNHLVYFTLYDGIILFKSYTDMFTMCT